MFNRFTFGTPTPTPKRARLDGVESATPTPAPAPVNGTPGAPRPLRLVYCDEKGQFKMDVEAVAALQLVKGPIGVVSVCGRARQGKSFILNQLLGRSSGFQVGPTHRPCTKGLWMWSSPLKRTAPDGTEYNLVLLDSEGIDAYDQTGTYSTQIFSLAVLLSSMFVYNQMGGIDEAALDRLSLVTEMTKHIRVRASQRTSTEELGQFSPVFLWLLRDFYLDLTEDGRRITPRDYLESALQPMIGSGKAVYAKNEIRESIRALFPDRHCFTLVRPINDEQQLQRLDLMPVEKLRVEFRSGLGSLTRFIFERTRPKQLGSTVMTGPMLAGLTQSFLDALNLGAVPTIATSWQNVEENECRRAFELALEAYSKSFDKSTPPDMAALQEAYDKAVEASLAVYKAKAVGAGPIRTKYEKNLQVAVKKVFEDYKQRAAMEAELKCLKAVESMDEKLRYACHSPSASLDEVTKVLNDLIVQYESSIHGPAKWEKLAKFLQQSLQGTVSDMLKKVVQQAASRAASLELKCRSLEDQVSLSSRQVEAAQREALDWKRRYEASISDYKSATEVSASQYSSLQSKQVKLEEKQASVTQQLEAAMKEALDWQNKYEHAFSERRSDEERYKSEYAALQSRFSAAEARLAAAREQADSAKEEANEWRRKHETVVEEARSTAERYNALRERGNKHQQQREDALRAEFSSTLSQKDTQLNDLQTKLEQHERDVTDLRVQLLDATSKADSLEKRLEERESEFETVLQDAHNQSANTIDGLRNLLESERAALSEANARAETLSLQLQAAHGRMEAQQHELATARLSEAALEAKCRAQAESTGRRKRASDDRDGDTERTPAPSESRGRHKRARADTTTNLDNGSTQGVTPGESTDDHVTSEHVQDYRKFTIAMLKQELTKAGFGARILQMKSAPKREFVALYEKLVLNNNNNNNTINENENENENTNDNRENN